MSVKKPRNLMEFDEIIKMEFNKNKTLLIPLLVSLDIKNPLFYRQNILGINFTSSHAFVISTIYKIPIVFRFKSPKYHFSIVGIRSCVPQSENSFNCYHYSNSKIISLLGWRRIMELEFYISAKNLDYALSFTEVKALQTIELPIKGEKYRYHLIAVHNVFPDESVRVNPEKLLFCAGKTREFLFSLFNEYEEKEDDKFRWTGKINFEKLMAINHRYQNPPRES